MKKFVIIILIAIGGYLVFNLAQNSENLEVKQNTEGEMVLKDGTELKYTSPNGDFSFDYFAPYVLTKLEDQMGETLLLQNNGSGIQIFITDWDPKNVLNSVLVKKELGSSGEQISGLEDVGMPAGFKAVKFLTQTNSGETLDVWFTNESTLYQITVLDGHEKLLKKLVDTWKFE